MLRRMSAPRQWCASQAAFPCRVCMSRDWLHPDTAPSYDGARYPGKI